MMMMMMQIKVSGDAAELCWSLVNSRRWSPRYVGELRRTAGLPQLTARDLMHILAGGHTSVHRFAVQATLICALVCDQAVNESAKHCTLACSETDPPFLLCATKAQ